LNPMSVTRLQKY
ncbi:hypothetical protein, partial [Plasmodium yoelii yoelii]